MLDSENERQDFTSLPVVESYRATPTSVLKTEGSHATLLEVIGAGSHFYYTKAEINPHDDRVSKIVISKDPTGYGFYVLSSETELPSCLGGRWSTPNAAYNAVQNWLESLL